jgi:hypothetical protein
MMLGFSLDWHYDTPTTIIRKLNSYVPGVLYVKSPLPSLSVQYFTPSPIFQPPTILKLAILTNYSNIFMDMNAGNTPMYDKNLLNWFGSEVGKVGGMLELTMAPDSDLTSLPDSVFDQLAQQCKDINTRYGVPILLRFGHDMNSKTFFFIMYLLLTCVVAIGDWKTYGNKPTSYIQAFRRLTTFVRKYTNLTAMVWFVKAFP